MCALEGETGEEKACYLETACVCFWKIINEEVTSEDNRASTQLCDAIISSPLPARSVHMDSRVLIWVKYQ